MKVFVIFWINTDNYRGIVVGDSNMSKKDAEGAYLRENPLESGIFAVEEQDFIDETTPAYTY